MVPVSQHEQRFLQHMLESVVFVTPSRNTIFLARTHCSCQMSPLDFLLALSALLSSA